MTTETLSSPALDVVGRIAERAFSQMVAMIHIANNRKDKQPGDPKVGGHPAACASCYQVLGALHLVVREPQDYVACKPHASPIDHAYHHNLRLFRREDGTWLDDDTAKGAMERLRKFPVAGASDVFQSYHAKSDPDTFHFLPSGSVGIPPVNSVYLALAYRFAKDHGHEVPEGAHFWSLMGDSEFREGSLLEVMPEVAERGLHEVTWIVDYNRQNLDGTRTSFATSRVGSDAERIEGTFVANGWKVIQLRHGGLRELLFERSGGDELRQLLERDLTDYDLQYLLYRKDAALSRELCTKRRPSAKKFLSGLSDGELLAALADLGAHDMERCVAALRQARADTSAPYLIVAHTLKGKGLECAADPANHSILPSKKEVEGLLAREGLTMESPFEHFAADTEEARYLSQRQKQFRRGMEAHDELIARNRERAQLAIEAAGTLPNELSIDTSLFPLTHTQWMWGQLAAKLIRIGTHGEGGAPIGGAGEEKPLDEQEARWAPAARFVMTLSPDVGTSTNLAPTMNSRIYGPGQEAEAVLDFQARHPELVAKEQQYTRHVRFEIVEANCMSALGSFGKLETFTGVPLLPVMTVYDFFLKRALDQLYYNLYWGSSFVLIGTPSGVTLSPEGAQHSWKSDIQIPNLITFEPAFAVEMDWILSDALKRHMEQRTKGRSGVLIRAVTRGIKQGLLLENLRRQRRFKQDDVLLSPPTDGDFRGAVAEAEVAPRADAEILNELREEVLAGAYRLVDWRGYAGYAPGDNVVSILVMGSLVTEALEAASVLLELGIYADVIVVTSPDLLLGGLAHETGYRHLSEGLGLSGDLHLVAGGEGATLDGAGLAGLAGRRVPIVAVCDGEAGLLDNAGSVLGVKQITLAVRRFSKCGRPDEVFGYQSIDDKAIVDAVGKALSDTALEDVRVSADLLERLSGQSGAGPKPHWRELWPGREPE